MDFTTEETHSWLEPSMQAGRTRRRAVIYDEDECAGRSTPSSDQGCSGSADNLSAEQAFQAPHVHGMTVRYVISWTQILVGPGILKPGSKTPLSEQTHSLLTHVINLDIMSHFTVFETIELAVKEFSSLAHKEVGERDLFAADQLQNWECRFSRKDCLPRFDYPCRNGLM